jgi:arylsulfatase A-like enzyme
MATKQPNLVLVFPDQMRGSALGFLGEEPVLTPNLDRFAEQSLVLPHAVANYPVCSPYRAMLMTGKYPHSNHVIGNCNSQTAPFGVELRAGERCWSDVLKDDGYNLGYIGKWHLDAPHAPYVDCANNRGELKWNEWCAPQRRHGFDFWYAYGTYDYHTRPMYWRTDVGRDDFHYVDQWGPEHEAELAISYIQNIDQPFALVVSMNPPHMPYELVPDRYVDRYRHLTVDDLCQRPNIPPAGTRWGDYYRTHIRNYYAMISGVDEQFGRILQAIEETGLTEDTIVLFTSDHGNCLGIHNERSKPNPYEECMRVPFIIRWPGQINPRRDDVLLSAPDVAPTLIDLLGSSAEYLQGREGRSHAGLCLGKTADRPTSQLYLRTPVAQPSAGARGLRTHRHTLVRERRLDGALRDVLYDNVMDPYQLRNVAAERPELVAALSDELQGWLEQTNDPWLAAG